MKVLFVILVVSCCFEVNSQSVGIAGLKTPFASISKALEKRNYEVAIVADESSNNLIQSIASAAVAEVPHNVAWFRNTE